MNGKYIFKHRAFLVRGSAFHSKYTGTQRCTLNNTNLWFLAGNRSIYRKFQINQPTTTTSRMIARSSLRLSNQLFRVATRYGIKIRGNNVISSSSSSLFKYFVVSSTSYVEVDLKNNEKNNSGRIIGASNVCRGFSTFKQVLQEVKSIHQQQHHQQLDTQNWTLDTFVSDVVTEKYMKENMEEFIEVNLKLLKSNQIKTLKEWKALSEEIKQKYPDGLKTTLNNALAKSKFLISLDINIFVRLCIYININSLVQ